MWVLPASSNNQEESYILHVYNFPPATTSHKIPNQIILRMHQRQNDNNDARQDAVAHHAARHADHHHAASRCLRACDPRTVRHLRCRRHALRCCSTVRSLFVAKPAVPLYEVKRRTDGSTKTIQAVCGFADAKAQDVFCADGCVIQRIFDETDRQNPFTLHQLVGRTVPQTTAPMQQP